MRELPENKFFEGFYIWFDKDKKEEYYGTPLYLYNVDTKVDYDKRQVKLYLKKGQFDGSRSFIFSIYRKLWNDAYDVFKC